MEPKILILDGNQRAALAATRSLGMRKIWVSVGESTGSSLAGSSKHCVAQLTYSDPFKSPSLFFKDILKLIEDYDINFLLPITEATTYAILAFREQLPPHVSFPFPDVTNVESLANKNSLFRLAKNLNIPIPYTVFCENGTEGQEVLVNHDWQFPIVIKPFKSKILLSDRIISTSVVVAKSHEEAMDVVQAGSFRDYAFTIQAFVEGEGQGVFALYNHGQPVCFFAHRRLREKPPEGGVSVLSESIPVDKHLKSLSEQLLTHANWHGVAMVEFRVEPNGTAYLMEVNPRFWGSLQLAIDSGVDFPYWLYLAQTGFALPDNRSITRRKVRWLLGDLDRLYLVLKAPLSRYSVLRKTKEFLLFFMPRPGTRHEINRVNDFRPFLFELRNYLHSIFKG